MAGQMVPEGFRGAGRHTGPSRALGVLPVKEGSTPQFSKMPGCTEKPFVYTDISGGSLGRLENLSCGLGPHNAELSAGPTQPSQLPATNSPSPAVPGQARLPH